jgi:hypothetical protein
LLRQISRRTHLFTIALPEIGLVSLAVRIRRRLTGRRSMILCQ